MRPDVSVVIPTRDRRRLLALTLASVMRQQDVRIEVIVVDDGSSDGSADSVEALGDPRVRVLRHAEAMGVSAARNDGIDASTGRWIAFVDDDDLWAPRKLAAQVRAAEGSGSPWGYAGVVKIDLRQRIVGGTPPPAPEQVAERLPRWNLVPGGCSGVIATREAIDAAGRFDRNLVNLADWDLWIRLGRRGIPACVSEPLVAYRVHPTQASLDSGLILREARLLDGRYGGRIDRAALHHYLAHRSLVAGRRGAALEHFARAALRGRARAAVADLRGLAAARLVRRAVPSATPSDVSWREEARRWLAELEEDVERRAVPG